MVEPLTNAILAFILHLFGETLSGMEGLLHADLLHTGFPHVGLLLLGSTDAPAGTDQGRRHCPHSTGPWNRRHQDHPGRLCLGRVATVRCALHPKVTSRPRAVGRTIRGYHSIHGDHQEEPLQQKEEGGH
jgi:hypothetical protein